MKPGWCWRAADARANGLPAPEDPTECLAPCPDVTERAGELLELIALAGRQLRVGFGGAYGLDWTVIARLADDAGIATGPDWWRLLSAAEGELVAALNPPKEPGGPG